MINIKYSVKEVYKLSEDYDSIFINNTANFRPKYDLVQLSTRTINKTLYEDIFIIEPNCYYRIFFNEENPLLQDVVCTEDFNDSLLEAGLILQYNGYLPCLYIFNANKNMVYIKKGAILLNKEVE